MTIVHALYSHRFQKKYKIKYITSVKKIKNYTGVVLQKKNEIKKKDGKRTLMKC